MAMTFGITADQLSIQIGRLNSCTKGGRPIQRKGEQYRDVKSVVSLLH